MGVRVGKREGEGRERRGRVRKGGEKSPFNPPLPQYVLQITSLRSLSSTVANDVDDNDVIVSTRRHVNKT